MNEILLKKDEIFSHLNVQEYLNLTNIRITIFAHYSLFLFIIRTNIITLILFVFYKNTIKMEKLLEVIFHFSLYNMNSNYLFLIALRNIIHRYL